MSTNIDTTRAPYLDPMLVDILSAKTRMPSPADLFPVIQNALLQEKFSDACRELQDGEAVDHMMYMLQKYMDTTTSRDPQNRSRIVAFKRLHSLAKRSKKLVEIPVIDIVGDPQEVARGGYGIISKATYNGKTVAIKEIIYHVHPDKGETENTKEHEKLFLREILMWRQLTQSSHPNILRLIGITDPYFPKVKMVAPWQDNGNLMDYVKQPRAAQINRLRLLEQTCTGLMFLHNHVPCVLHADLKCANVLVKDDGTPCLADFGLATVRYDGATLTSALDGGGTCRWMARELLSSEGDLANKSNSSALKVTRYSDIWSFAMLALELLTEKVPFSEHSLSSTVVYKLQTGELPRRPSGSDAYHRGLGNELWRYLNQCWDKIPKQRTSLMSLLSLLGRLANGWTPPLTVEQKRQRTVEVTISVPTEVRGMIIGRWGANIRRYETDLDVKIDAGEDIKISGTRADVNEARSRIEDLVARQVNQTEKFTTIPRDLRPGLIGSGGVRIRGLEAKHSVKVRLDNFSDKASVVGQSENVNGAIEELRQTLGLDKERGVQHRLPISSRLASKLQNGHIVESAKIDISPANHGNGLVATLSAQSSDVLARVLKEIQDLDQKLSNEYTRTVTIPPQLHGLVLGSQWKRWGDLVVRCGGPADPKSQKDMIDINPSSPKVTLRGDSRVVDAVDEEIQMIVAQKDVYGMFISQKYHRLLRDKLEETQRRTNTLIILPTSHSRYSEYAEPINADKLQGKDVADIVKIIGTRDSYQKAYDELQTYIGELRRICCYMDVPLKYRHAIFEQIRRKLKEMEVHISPPSPPEVTPVQQPANGNTDILWEVIARYDKHITGTCLWTVYAQSPENLVEAQRLIQEAYVEVREARYIGYLTFPDKTKFGRIVGPRGEYLRNLEQDTKTTIKLPPKDDPENTTIVITGAREKLKIAKQRIEAIVTPATVRSTDRLFNKSKLSSPQASHVMHIKQ